jgi:polyhydroxybutyrate depolymerase
VRRAGRTAVAVAVLLAVTAACANASSGAHGRDGGSTAPTGAAPTTTRPTSTTRPTVAVEPSAGCRIGTATVPGDTTRTVVVAGAVRAYRLAVPEGYRAGVPAPLVLLFHGFSGSGAQIETLSRMPERADARTVVVVAPDGPDQTWQPSGTGSDAAIVDSIFTAVTQQLCVDRHRVYAAGFSAGAAFTIAYACARRDRIAAIATVAVEFQLGCRAPMPIVAFHGTVDPAVPYDDGATGASLPGVKVRGTLLNMGDWAKLARCTAAPTTTHAGSEVLHTVWRSCAPGTGVELYTVVGGSHTWPGADPAQSPLYTTRQIDATTVMLGFFARHHLG